MYSRFECFFYLSIALLENVSLSPFVRCRWHNRLATIPLQASDDAPPPPFDDDAPFDVGLCECSGGEPDIILPEDDDAPLIDKDG